MWIKHDRAFDTVTVHINRQQIYRRKEVRHTCSPAVQRYHFAPGIEAWKVR